MKIGIRKVLMLILCTVLLLQCIPFYTCVAVAETKVPAVLRLGYEGKAVKKLQQDLLDKGYFDYKKATGYYGAKTEEAVAAFQKANKLEADGIAGKRTLQKLWGDEYAKTLKSLGYMAKDDESPELSEAIKSGDRSDVVTKIQNELLDLGYFKEKKATGYFGSITQKAVKQFQMANDLHADGVVGAKTMDMLKSSKAVKYKDASDKIKNLSDEAETKQDKRTETANAIIENAKQYLGYPYVYGTAGPKTFDCTGFTTFILKQYDISVPRSAYQQGYEIEGEKLSRDQLKKGDLVFFNSNGRDKDLSDHAGIYMGNGEFIHCSSGSSGKLVKISSLDDGYYKKVFSWGKRVLF